MSIGGGYLTPPPKNAKLNTRNPIDRKAKQMTLGGYTYQVGDLFTTSKTGITGRIEKFVPQTKNVTRVMLRLANGQQRFAMVKTI
jgi:hypothetical protein